MTRIEAFHFIKNNLNTGISVEFATELITTLGIQMDFEGMTSVPVESIYNAFVNNMIEWFI